MRDGLAAWDREARQRIHGMGCENRMGLTIDILSPWLLVIQTG